MGIGSAIDVALSSLQSLTGTAVTYRRGQSSVCVTAIPGKTEYETMGEDGFTVLAQTRDFIIRCSDLVLGGAGAIPARGDRITETVNGVALTYEALALNGDVFRFVDQYRTAFRVHTKQVG